MVVYGGYIAEMPKKVERYVSSATPQLRHLSEEFGFSAKAAYSLRDRA